VPLGVRFRTASLLRALALVARESSLEAIVPRSRQSAVFSLLEGLCRDRHPSVAFRAAFAVGMLESAHPNLPSVVGLLDGSPVMVRRRIVSVAARWVLGDIDDATLDTFLEEVPGSRDSYARATLVQGLRLGLAHAPRTILERVTAIVADSPVVVLASAAALANDLEDEAERSNLTKLVTDVARRKNLHEDPALRVWLAPGAVAADLLADVRAQRRAALLSPHAGGRAAGELLGKLRTTVASLARGELGDADDVESVLDGLLFDSTVFRDSLAASATTRREAVLARDAWLEVVRTLRERRATQALKPGLHESQRRERIRILAHSLDALAADAADDAGNRALLGALVEQARREVGTVNDRPLAIALAACIEAEIGAGRLTAAEAYVVLSQLPGRFFRHLAVAFSDAEIATAFTALDHFDRILASFGKADGSDVRNSRQVGEERQRVAHLLEAALWRVTRSIAGLGATGRHPLARAYGGATATTLYVMQNRPADEPVVEAWSKAVVALGEALATARATFGLPHAEGPKADVLMRRIREAFTEASLEHATNTRALAPKPLDQLLDVALALRGGLEGVTWRGTKVGDFVVVKELGAGGMGRCLLARLRSDRLKDGAQWVVKLPNESSRGERGKVLRDLFREEAKALLALAGKPHPAIVGFVAYHEQGYGLPFMVMRFVPGTPLSSRIEQRAMTRDEVLDVAIRLANGLAHAHAHGVGHHDVKPDNIILAEPGDGPVLVDWGLAGAAFRGMAGTPGYMAPERFSTRSPAREHAFSGDVFALGCIIAEMVMRAPLISDEAHREDDVIVPGFRKALQMMPSEGHRWRFACQSIATNPELLAVRIDSALAGEPALLGVVRAMLEADPALRPSASQASQLLLKLRSG
jgi:hypothetical protein